MKKRTRIRYTTAQKADIWDRWKNGESMHDIASTFDRYHSSIQNILTENGGIRPATRVRAAVALSLEEREAISRGLAADQSIRGIAVQINRAPSTISREINRNGGRKAYRATLADSDAWKRGRRPKSCKLSTSPLLRRMITEKLIKQWSPEQISGWLKKQYPDDESYHVSHETIYKSLFIQTRGVLKKELLMHLRTQRSSRRPKKATLKGKRIGNVPNAIPISERPASVEDRAIPGHWEGDLIEGSLKTYVVTLVERHSRYVMLAKVADKKSETVMQALVKQARKLPGELYKSLTWDRGAEMKKHYKFTCATNIQIYFCDPYSPWQRGSNENTNRLLRDYLPKGTDLSAPPSVRIDVCAAALRINRQELIVRQEKLLK